jgi:hypothetical protein
MDKNKPSIIIIQLVLVGSRKNYVVPFTEGVNIIYGDSATGKSSILECINYLLGGSKLIYDQEIESSVKFIMMELMINGRSHVIKRQIFKPGDLIEVYVTNLNSLENVFPKKFAPKFDGQSGPDGYFSDFLMSALGIPNVKMRQAPSKPDSQMVRLSFRDVFKYCYLRQDDVGSRGLLGSGNYPLETKNKETFKYLFNLLDTNVSDLQTELALLINYRNKLKNKYDAVTEFLRETEFDTEFALSDEEHLLSEQEEAIRLQLEVVNSTMVASNENYAFLKETLLELVGTIAVKEKDFAESDLSVDRYVRLKNDYQNDIEKLKSIRLAQSAIGNPAESFSCPLCASTVKLADVKSEYSIADDDRTAQEANALTRRIRDLNLLIQSERDKNHQLISVLKSLKDDRDKARLLLDEETGRMISPYLSERDGLSTELSRLQEKRKQIAHAIKIRNQQKSIFEEIVNNDDQLVTMQTRLNELIAAAPSLEEVMSDLGDFLSAYLRHVKIKDQRDVLVSKRTFLPVLRGRDYREMTSGGLRTILSIGHHLSIIEAAITRQSNLPTFLMIDTVGKYLGKTQSKYSNETNVDEDRREELSDPGKYLNIYTYMFAAAERAKRNNVAFQIILVDNDVPPEIQRTFAGSIVAHFNSEGSDGMSRGLIDDAHLDNI